MHPNRLLAESSPYLRQHAYNPVDWYPWSGAALAAARGEDKPILLSIGYSACHWCHVMAHESFEDPATAALMNQLFVNIKVDREERPDLDKIYQVAQQLITQRAGGWPLTMFLTGDEQQPFFGGTYFPREARHGLPGFRDLLPRVADYYRAHREEIRAQSGQLRQAFAAVMPPGGPPGAALDDSPIRLAHDELEQSFDAQYGGFGPPPKFPRPSSIDRCLRQWHSTIGGEVDLRALHMGTLTLTRMAEGGLCDQLFGGFFRYSVDGRWMIPHFEKMLYDNGPLLAAYAEAYLATGEPLYARTAAAAAEWALADLRADEGGFYSSLDADTDGHEGKFYVWSAAAAAALLTAPEYAAFAPRFGLDREANFEGSWHLYACSSIGEIAARLDRTPQSVAGTIDSAREKLLAARGARTKPARDDKILTAWNALMIKGLAIASRALDRPQFGEAAEKAVDFIRNRLWQDGRLLASYADRRARLPAYLDDYAFLADALLELLQIRWRTGDFEFLLQLVEVLLAKFEDEEFGGFYFTASDHEKLIYRNKAFSDESLPAGNAVAARVLCRLGYLLADTRYLEAGERVLTAGWPLMLKYPSAHMSLVNALEEFLGPTQIVIIRASPHRAGHWLRELGRLYAPARIVLAIPEDAAGLPRTLADKRPAHGTVAYLCTGMTCSPPITDLDELRGELGRSRRTASAGD